MYVTKFSMDINIYRERWRELKKKKQTVIAKRDLFDVPVSTS